MNEGTISSHLVLSKSGRILQKFTQHYNSGEIQQTEVISLHHTLHFYFGYSCMIRQGFILLVITRRLRVVILLFASNVAGSIVR